MRPSYLRGGGLGFGTFTKIAGILLSRKDFIDFVNALLLLKGLMFLFDFEILLAKLAFSFETEPI